MSGSKPNPWRRLASRGIYANPWISVREDRVINPAGGEGIYGVVNFQNLAVGVIPLEADGSIWLVGQHRYPLDAYSWEIPEGGCPLGQDPLAGAQRELAEETGLRAGRWDRLLELHLSNSVTDERAVIYLARTLTPGPTAHEDTEDISLRRLPLQAAIGMVWRGEITDAISVAGLLALQGRRGEFGV